MTTGFFGMASFCPVRIIVSAIVGIITTVRMIVTTTVSVVTTTMSVMTAPMVSRASSQSTGDLGLRRLMSPIGAFVVRHIRSRPSEKQDHERKRGDQKIPDNRLFNIEMHEVLGDEKCFDEGNSEGSNQSEVQRYSRIAFAYRVCHKRPKDAKDQQST